MHATSRYSNRAISGGHQPQDGVMGRERAMITKARRGDRDQDHLADPAPHWIDRPNQDHSRTLLPLKRGDASPERCATSSKPRLCRAKEDHRITNGSLARAHEDDAIGNSGSTDAPSRTSRPIDQTSRLLPPQPSQGSMPKWRRAGSKARSTHRSAPGTPLNVTGGYASTTG